MQHVSSRIRHHSKRIDHSTGFALYRALLRQTFKLPVSQQGKDHFKDQVKKRTRENSRLQGHWNITIALRLGYEVPFEKRYP